MKHELLSAQALVHVGAGEEFVTRGIPAYLILRSITSNLGFTFLGFGICQQGIWKKLFLSLQENLQPNSISSGILTQDCVKK